MSLVLGLNTKLKRSTTGNNNTYPTMPLQQTVNCVNIVGEDGVNWAIFYILYHSGDRKSVSPKLNV